MIDFTKAKVVLMDEYTSNNERSDIEISAFHQGLNYMIDYILEEENEGILHDYVPNEILYNKENSTRAVESIRREYKKKEEDIMENYRLRLKVKEILLERKMEALRKKTAKEKEELIEFYEGKLAEYKTMIEEYEKRIH